MFVKNLLLPSKTYLTSRLRLFLGKDAKNHNFERTPPSRLGRAKFVSGFVFLLLSILFKHTNGI